MIPIALQPEPATFDAKVRQKGLRWLQQQNFPNGRPPKSNELSDCWKYAKTDLRNAYSSICAYLCIYLEPASDDGSIDHFIPKSVDARMAYEWTNYRFCSIRLNRKKGTKQGILDPIGLAPNTFLLNLFDGTMRPNEMLPPDIKQKAENTIASLDLNSADCKNMRAVRFSEYTLHKNRTILKKYAPFIWYEAQRQGLL